MAREALTYVGMANDPKWRSYKPEELKSKVRETRKNYVGHEFIVGFLPTNTDMSGKRVRVVAIDEGRFICECVDSDKAEKKERSQTTGSTGPSSGDSESDHENSVRLNIHNLVPLTQQNTGVANKGMLFPFLQQVSDKGGSNLGFERLERKLAQAIYYIKGSVPKDAKDKTLFNRDIFSGLNLRYRADELHRLDLLEIILKAKKFYFLDIRCKEMCLWEDDERILRDDLMNIETNHKRLRISNLESARNKIKLKEQNLLYASALLAVRPACVGNGSVNFGNFDEGIPRDANYDTQIYTRLVKFVKYGMCECCQLHYLENNGRAAAECRPVQHNQRDILSPRASPLTTSLMGSSGTRISSSQQRPSLQLGLNSTPQR